MSNFDPPKDPRNDDDRVAINRRKFEAQMRSADRDPNLRPPIDRNAHRDRRHDR
jgi:hypothetical protein